MVAMEVGSTITQWAVVAVEQVVLVAAVVVAVQIILSVIIDPIQMYLAIGTLVEM
jgi:hypothetical protein